MNKPEYKKFFDLKGLIANIKDYSPEFNQEKFEKAFEFAEEAHTGQLRKDGTTPYITHPVKVTEILAEMHSDEDILIAALLHDVPEDTHKTLAEIEDKFGRDVAFLVDGITKFSKVQYKNNMPQREVESLKKLLLHSIQDPRVILIKLADRLHNMRTLHNIEKPEKRLRIAKETLEIYVPIANLLGIQYLRMELQELCFKYLLPKEYEELRVKIEQQQQDHRKALSEFVHILEQSFKENGINGEIFERKRNLYNIYKKITSEGKTISDVENRIAVRILVDKLSSCYQALGIIHGKFMAKTDKLKDYIANPKANGYKSLHTSVFGHGGYLTQVQIRTREMNIQVEYGVAEHLLRNEVEKLSQDERSAWVNKISELDQYAKKSGEFLENLKLDIFEDRILVYTPEGKGVDLPKGAAVIDFAYAIDPALGNRACGAEINGKTVLITKVLKSGDIVKVLASKTSSAELFWLSFAKTNFAKNQIKIHLKHTSKDRRMHEGARFLQKEFDIASLGVVANMNFKKISEAIGDNFEYSYNNIEDVLVAIGQGDLKAVDVVKSIKKDAKEGRKSGMIKVIVKIVAKNRFGLLRDVSEVLYRNASDMSYLKGYTAHSEEDAYFTAKILVKDIASVGKTFDELVQIEGVKDVYRVSNKGLILTYIFGTITAFLWILHPLLLKMQDQNPWVLNIVLFCLFLSVILVMNVVKKYFPYIRKKLLLWAITFSLPVLSLLILLIEIFYFNLQLNWTSLLIEIAIIYTYLGISFFQFRKRI
ncbi:bifunctional (p)ppGpp synthetase/guanosine-3',5'-bis(diphosphate) 3'-pyrophosphohydrolase [Candidatus Peregrinibacteria bacterium]|nr:bifunctional (p)ppGpp synthetase/guanosine-3',5'-bis(diphosphate) 3'-pyrophosphohydrolase [Candidatus Peregrinibacteria bacterium]